MDIEAQLKTALASADPLEALRQAVRNLLTQGRTREEVLARLEHVRETLPEEAQNTDKDIILEVMDFLTGWCSPHMVI